MDESFSIRPFREQDLPKVLALMRLSLGEPPGLPRRPELFAWKHSDNPFGRSLILVAEDRDVIVGLRTLMRWRLTLPTGGSLRCVRAVDTATHPDYRRRGVFRRLTMEALDIAKSEGVDLVFNTPNERSLPGYLTMGWTDVGRIGVMVRPTTRLLTRFDATKPQHPLAPGLAITAERRMVWPDRSPLGLRTPRTPDYLTWRFGSHPTASYFAMEVEDGVAVGRTNTRRGRQELVVSELFGSGAEVALRRLYRATRPDYLVGWFSTGSPERRRALRAGMLPIPRVTALTLVARPLHHLDIDVGSLRSWDVSMGDFELL